MAWLHRNEEGKVMFRGLPCPYCHKSAYLWAFEKDADEYFQGSERSLGEIFPYFSVSEKEALITGICDECWKKIFGQQKSS